MFNQELFSGICISNMSSEAKKPVKPFLKVLISKLESDVELVGFCAGYENGSWRADEFSRYLVRNLPQFTLPIEKWEDFQSSTAVEQLSRSARAIYTTKKYENRGEIGELILFAIMRTHYQSEPLVSKFFFKSSSNDTVKGFDAIHIVNSESGPELWLGEVKFYTLISAAIRDVVSELDDHLKTDFLREEFMWIDNKLSFGSSKYPEIQAMLDDSKSLDEVFETLHIPVLLTYKSKAVGDNNVDGAKYRQEIEQELASYFQAFVGKGLPQKVSIHLLLVPLEGKAKLLKSFDDRLKALQTL